MSRGDFDSLRALMADDFVEHEELPGIEGATGKEAVLNQFQALRTGFPDFTMNLEDMIAEGDRVFIRATMRGTHKGDFVGMPGTGKQIEVPCGDFVRIVNGKAVEHWGVTDTGTMMQQLGLVEAPGEFEAPGADVTE
jgi:steroid delta-isomerase-like uncharacterized protein